MLDFLPESFQGYGIFVIETALVILAMALALSAPSLGDSFFRRCEEALGSIARRPVLSMAIMLIAPLALRVMLGQLRPIPAPFIHDEFGYLLAGDTFAHGRLTNPMHPLWIFFESIHQIQHPTYSGMYQPAQGFFLAIGEVLTGIPWFGVALSAGVMCATLLWMLRGLFSPGWAFLGASIAVIRLGVFSYWMSGYWGGCLPAAGGALVAGAAIRLWKAHPTSRSGGLTKRRGTILGLVLGLGLVTLAESRPLEGALFSIPILIALLWKYVHWKNVRWQVVAPVLILCAMCGAFIGYYNWRVTGDALQLPQMLQRQQYAIYAYGAFTKPRPEPVYRHDVIRNFYVTTEHEFKSSPETVPALITDYLYREKVLLWFFLGPLLILPVLLGARALLSKKLAVLGIAFLAVSLGFAWLVWPINSHYYAPVTCAVYAYIIQSLRHVRFAPWKGGPVGVSLVRSLTVICLLMAGIRGAAGPLGIEISDWPMAWFNTTHQNHLRARIIKSLEMEPENSLIIVRYADSHNPGDEWVYNGADIDGAKVVWAREMPTGNQKLLDYFKDRRALLLEPDYDPNKLVPYKPLNEGAR